jgi:hypothetical protein
MASTVIPDFDAAAAHPEVAALRRALLERDWSAVRAIYDPMGWDGRQLLVYDAADQAGVEDFLQQVIERAPDDVVAKTMYAVRLVVMGWDVRTAARAKDVSREQFEVFFDHLRRAEAVLIWVCAKDPGNAAAWCERITTARALQLGQSEARRRYDRIVEQVPHYLPAQTALLQQLCPKWSGDMAAMHAFALQCAQDAPAGAHNGALVVDGHLEHWLEVEGDTYWKDPSVRAEIRAAGERSVLHPDFRRTPGWVSALNMFAAGYSLIEEWSLAKRCFLELGPYANKWAWMYFKGGPQEAFARNRNWAMERG